MESPTTNREELELFQQLYEHLRHQARHAMRHQKPGHTLQPTALVHEVYLRVQHATDKTYKDRSHFFALAARAMRSVLVDHARTRNREKRRSEGNRLPLDDVALSYEDRVIDILAFDEALSKLTEFDPSMSQAVELRLFAGWSIEECAQHFGMAKRSFERKWQLTRTWLHREIA